MRSVGEIGSVCQPFRSGTNWISYCTLAGALLCNTTRKIRTCTVLSCISIVQVQYGTLTIERVFVDCRAALRSFTYGSSTVLGDRDINHVNGMIILFNINATLSSFYHYCNHRYTTNTNSNGSPESTALQVNSTYFARIEGNDERGIISARRQRTKNIYSHNYY